MGNIVRVGVTFPPDLLGELDRATSEMGCKSRSKVINDAVRAFVNEQEWLADVRGNRVGSITMIYNHELRELEADLTDTQHEFKSIISASMHIHLSKDKCLEAIIAQGSAQKIKALVQKLRARRGVEEVRLSIFAAV
jgi:CopG family nickel-responsive transcriptional regulator